jgi:hypothetical protein
MRAFAIIPLCLVAACSGGEEKKAEAAGAMQAGQWETTSEVISFKSTDKATPALKAAAGDKSTAPACIEEKDAKKPEPELFAGEGYECKYKSDYIRNGRINASLDCKRDAIKGDIMMTVQGSYTGDSFQATVDTISYLPGEGDFQMSSKIAGRRTGASCAAPPADGAGNASGSNQTG